MNRHSYTLVVTTNKGERLYQFRHQTPARRMFRQYEHYLGKEGLFSWGYVVALRLIRDDGMERNGFPKVAEPLKVETKHQVSAK